MRALVLDGEPRLATVPEPPVSDGEARIAVRVAGVCDTDLQLARGYMGFSGVPGHEFVGEVLTGALAGRRVVADINAGCGACADCTEGPAGLRGHHCPTRSVLGIVTRSGAFAERLALPERCLVPVPDELPDDRAVFAEPVAAALHVSDDLTNVDGPIAVLGDGKLGLLIAMALHAEGRALTLVGHHADKLALASRLGIPTTLEADLPRTAAHAAVVDATGHGSGLALALTLCRPRGRVILKTTVKDPGAVDWSLVVIHELSIVGSRCGDVARAIDVLARGLVDPTPLVEARYPLDRALEAFHHAGRRGARKVLVDVAAQRFTR
jgi:threonine dehydrogenase-like Zn-dependent dehydrogenase